MASRVVREPRTRRWWLGGIALSVVALGALAFAGRPDTDTDADPPPRPSPQEMDGDLVVALMRAGLDAESLTAAGVSSESMASIVAAATTAYDQGQGTALAQADADYFAARTAHDRLQRKVRSCLANDQEKADFQTARSDLASAEAARTAALEALFDAGTAGLGTAELAALANIQANKSWSVPMEFKVSLRSQEDWVALRAALSNERIAANYEDEELAPESATLLSACRTESDVAAASVRLTSDLPSALSAWEYACVR